MSRVVFLDAGPLGLVTNPRVTVETIHCNQWLRSLLASSNIVVVPEITDYEIGRELLRGNKLAGLARLDALKTTLHYAPITTAVMLLAARFWADIRKQGKPTADDRALDADVILAAQAVTRIEGGDEVVVATSNVGHLSRFCDARRWQDIQWV